MNIIPTLHNSKVLKEFFKEDYTCPLCNASSTSEPHDPMWVYTPIIDQPICQGCCYDYYSAARSRDFENHFYRNLFDEASEITGNTPHDIRLACLKHQEALLIERLKTATDELYREEYRKLQKEVQKILREIGE